MKVTLLDATNDIINDSRYEVAYEFSHDIYEECLIVTIIFEKCDFYYRRRIEEVELYNIHIDNPLDYFIIMCMGEMDRLVAEKFAV